MFAIWDFRKRPTVVEKRGADNDHIPTLATDMSLHAPGLHYRAAAHTGSTDSSCISIVSFVYQYIHIYTPALPRRTLSSLVPATVLPAERTFLPPKNHGWVFSEAVQFAR